MLRSLRLVLRAFRREPSFVAGVTLTFALAIGVNASMLGVVERLMLAPPPGISEPARVVEASFAYGLDDGRSFPMSTTSWPHYRALASVGALAAVAAVRTDSMTIGDGADQVQVAGVAASGTYFTVLGVHAARGRLFDASDDEPPVGNDVVVLSWGYWQRRYAGDASALGARLVVNGQPLTVIGVTPRGFHGAGIGATDIIVPFSTASRTMAASVWTNPGMRILAIIGRLKDDVTPQAAAAMATAAVRGVDYGSEDVSVRMASIGPGAAERGSPQGRIALALSAVAVAVLLIATANVGTLLRLRAARRRRDLAVQVALGARPAGLVRRSITEGIVLAGAGCMAGLVLARWCDGLVRVTLLPSLAPADGLANRLVLFASLAMAVASGFAAGLAPMRQALRWNLVDDLRQGASYGASHRLSGQRILLGLQVGLSTVLLVGAGLFVRSLNKVRSQDLGFSTARLLHVELRFRERLGGAEQDAVYQDAIRRLAQLPGVTAVTPVQGLPFGAHNIPPVSVPGFQLPPPSVAQLPIMYAATPAYLGMMGVVLVRGRLLNDLDTPASPLVVLVNETMARTVWEGQDPIGRCVRAGFGGPPGIDPMEGTAYLPCREVVGIVRDSRARSLRTEGGEEHLMQYYVPFTQLPAMPGPSATIFSVLVETTGAPASMAGQVQRLVQGTSSRPVVALARPYQDLIDPQLASWRLGASLFSAFGVLALAMAAVGLYAAVSYLASQRRREVGIRLALGGRRAGIVSLVVRDAIRMAAAGIVAGAAVSVAAAPLVRDLLFQTSPRDPAIIAGAAVVLLAVAAGAAAVPSWRASRVDASEVLRVDN